MPGWLKWTSFGFCLLFAVLFFWVSSMFAGLDTAATTGKKVQIAAWIFAGLTAGCLFIPGPKPLPLPILRVEDAAEPTFRLYRRDAEFPGEIWQLVLGENVFRLIRPSGEPALTLPRKWSEDAIKRPNFVETPYLAIVRESWQPPEEAAWLDSERLVQDLKNARRMMDQDVAYYFFEPVKELIQEVAAYQSGSAQVLGQELVQPLRIKGQKFVRSGMVAVVVGCVLIAVGFLSYQGPRPDHKLSGSVQTGILGGMALLLGFARVYRGLIAFRRAGKIA